MPFHWIVPSPSTALIKGTEFRQKSEQTAKATCTSVFQHSVGTYACNASNSAGYVYKNVIVNLLTEGAKIIRGPEKYQIVLFNKLPPSKDPIGIKFKKPRKRFNIATLFNIFVNICSLDSVGLLMKIRINAVEKHNKGLTIEIFILPKAV